ncbi:MAG: DUF4832 domain-containing protein, partial [Bdellovibrionales bacterium]|nr:DUF4832 domain-containing protein [Bdellovibrionales bacterium]
RVSFSGKECSNAGNECANRWAFNHDDPIFIQQQVELIEALRAQYDNPQWAAKIAYIDVRSIGSWSESHTTNVYVDNRNYRWPMPKWSNYKQILDAHLKFQHIPQIVNFDNDEAVSMQETNGNHPWDYTCKQAMSTGKTVGWRTDGIESTYLEIAEVMGWSSAARDCWKVGPIYAEAMSGDGLVDDSKTSVNEITQGMERLTEWHASGFNNKYSNAYPQDSFFTTTVNNWLLKAGYRLQIANASIPNIVQANTNVQVNVNLKNTGTAPFFRSFYSLKMRFVPVGGGNSVIINLPGSLKNVVPGAGNSTFSGTGQLAKGTYDVYVGIVQDPTFTTSFPVKLAQQSSLCSKVGNDWWCKIGQSQAQ